MNCFWLIAITVHLLHNSGHHGVMKEHELVRSSALTGSARGRLLFALVKRGMTEKQVLLLFGKKATRVMIGTGPFTLHDIWIPDYDITITIGIDGVVTDKVMQK